MAVRVNRIAARSWSFRAEGEMSQPDRSGRISSKHRGCSAGNRRRHGVGANRLHHHLQIERFLTNAQIIIEQSEADGVDRRNKYAPKQASYLSEDRPQEHEMRLL